MIETKPRDACDLTKRIVIKLCLAFSWWKLVFCFPAVVSLLFRKSFLYENEAEILKWPGKEGGLRLLAEPVQQLFLFKRTGRTSERASVPGPGLGGAKHRKSGKRTLPLFLLFIFVYSLAPRFVRSAYLERNGCNAGYRIAFRTAIAFYYKTALASRTSVLRDCVRCQSAFA